MELVRAGTGQHVDLPAGAAAIFRTIGTALHLELFDRVDTGRIQQTEISAPVHVVSAIERPVVLREAITVHGEVDLVGPASRSLNANVKRVAHSGTNSRLKCDQLP